MAGSIERTAMTVSANLPDRVKVGIDPMLLITIGQLLLGFLGECYKNGPAFHAPGGAGTPADTISDHYNAETDTFEESLMGPVRAQTRRAIRTNFRTNGGPRPHTFSQEYIEAQSKETLKSLMKDSAACVSCMAEIGN